MKIEMKNTSWSWDWFNQSIEIGNQSIKKLEQTNKHTQNAPRKCNAWPMSHPLHSFLGLSLL